MNRIVNLICLGTLLALGSGACNDAHRGEPRSAPTPISAEAKYTIIESSTMHRFKRSLTVRLDRKVSKEKLRGIAKELKKRERLKYERTFIVYLLPGMTPGAGAWATTHFNPNLEVRILGLTTEQEKALADEPEKSSRKIVGKWLDEGFGLPSQFTIYRQNGKLYMEQKFTNGSRDNQEMVEKGWSSGRRFEQKQGVQFGEYFVIDRNGNLQIRDETGLINTARKVE